MISKSSEYVGLFCSNSGKIQNLKVEGSIDINSDSYCIAGGIVGANYGEILNCQTKIDLNVRTYEFSYDSFIGSVAGLNGGSICRCISDGSVEIGGTLLTGGGIAGENLRDILECINKATVKSVISSFDREKCAGGIVGENRGMISKCINEGNIVIGQNYGGGIVGQNIFSEAVIDECVNLSDMETDFTRNINLSYAPKIGGICGYNWGATITNCYNMGNGIWKDNDGWNSTAYTMAGIVAKTRESKKIENCYSCGEIPEGAYCTSTAVVPKFSTSDENITNCYYNTETCIASDNVATGLTSEEMKTADFVSNLGASFSVDKNGINNGYPIFKWQTK